MKTKKFLVPFEQKHPEKKIKGFLCPELDGTDAASFFDIDTGKSWQFGMIVFIGKDISSDDVFARIINSGKKIISVSNTQETIESYLRAITNKKIGDVVRVIRQDNNIELIKV